MRELQGGERLGLQHGVQVDVAVGPGTQEEIPRPCREKHLLGCLPGERSLANSTSEMSR